MGRILQNPLLMHRIVALQLASLIRQSKVGSRSFVQGLDQAEDSILPARRLCAAFSHLILFDSPTFLFRGANQPHRRRLRLLFVTQKMRNVLLVLLGYVIRTCLSDAPSFIIDGSLSQLSTGQSTTVRWKGGTGDTVSLKLLSGSSSNLQGTLIASKLKVLIRPHGMCNKADSLSFEKDNVPNSGSYTFTIPSDTKPGSDYTIQIFDSDNNINFTPQFTIAKGQSSDTSSSRKSATQTSTSKDSGATPTIPASVTTTSRSIPSSATSNSLTAATTSSSSSTNSLASEVSASPSSSRAGKPSSSPAASASSSSYSSTKLGIGLGVPLGVLLLAFIIFISIYIDRRHRKPRSDMINPDRDSKPSSKFLKSFRWHSRQGYEPQRHELEGQSEMNQAVSEVDGADAKIRELQGSGAAWRYELPTRNGTRQ